MDIVPEEASASSAASAKMPKPPPSRSAVSKLQRAARAARRGSAMLKSVSALMSGGLKQAAQPDRLKAVSEDRKRRAEFSFVEGMGERFVWIADPDESFKVAKIVEERPDGSMAVEIGTSRQSRIVPKKDIAFPITRPSSLKVSFEDMVKMEDVNDATILHNLRMRFLDDQIYTNIGEWCALCGKLAC
jgi:hypothetical protein